MKLSQRLQAIADLVDKGARVGDIGTDHGQLPCYLVEKAIAPRVIAADINALPLAGAQKRIAESGFTEQITTRLGDGLTVLKPGEVDTVTISGMGGSLMTEILEASAEVVCALKQLILQPNLAAHLIRRWAAAHDWHIEQERLLYEDGRYYEVLSLRPGKGRELSEAELWLGPELLSERHPLLVEYVRRDWLAEKAILAQVAKSDSAEAKEKAQRLTEKWQHIEEAMRCRFSVEILSE